MSNGDDVRQGALSALADAASIGTPVYVSPITAWEIGMLAARGRLKISIPPARWFGLLLTMPGLKLAELSPDILIASNFLPGHPPNDPADRIIAATARHLGAKLVTRDRLLLAYAESGHLEAIAC